MEKLADRKNGKIKRLKQKDLLKTNREPVELMKNGLS
jgi:hypothetical protein